MKAAVLGAGSWGTTFAQVLCDAGTRTTLCSRRPQLAAALAERHENPEYLPGIALTPALEATSDPMEALAHVDLVVFAVPAQSLRTNLIAWAPLTSKAPAGALALQGACHTPYFRPYTNTDVTGCELGGAVKNIIAIAVGIAVAMGLGDNTKATLITRGLAEMARLGSALGADPQTFAGLAGMGDLVATCSSPLSRNRTFGENLGRGMSVPQAAAAQSQTAEGVASCGPVLALARARGVEMPITEVVEAVMRDGLPVAQAASMLASRSAKPEWYGP
jgi:glycerol-3-phosphate dehydrogenase (NAD(P)+)